MESQRKPLKNGWKIKIKVSIGLTPKIVIKSIILFLSIDFFLLWKDFYSS
jgi:hypothetical protein